MVEKETKSYPPRKEMNVLTFGGVKYRLVKLGGYGISRGLGSIVRAIDGESEGKLYEVNLRDGIEKIIGEITQEEVDKRTWR